MKATEARERLKIINQQKENNELEKIYEKIMNDIDFKIFCETRLKEIISKGPKPFLYYININNVIKQLPIGITPMIVGNNRGKKGLWSLICETQSKSDFKEWCLV